jgi:hypothetical protein
MKLTIYAIESSPVVAAKAIREALRVVNPGTDITLGNAQTLMGWLENEGKAFLAEVEAPDAAKLISALQENGVFATTGDPEQARRQYDAKRLSEAGASPEDVFGALAPGDAPDEASDGESDYCAQTGMVLLAITSGNPLSACAHASAFARTTGDPEFWTDVQASLIETFPWIAQSLRASGLLLGDDEA